MKTHYDIIIIGSGPGGYRAAILAALRKKTVAIIEMADWGGCCLNRGCVPKKTWHNTAKLLHKNNKLKEMGITGTLTPNFSDIWQHQKNTVTTVRDSYQNYMKRLGICAIQGIASFLNSESITVTTTDQKQIVLTASHIIIATGSKPFVPNLFQIESQRILSTDSLFDTLPPAGEEVAIIGSGVIATEFAFILKMLGKIIHWYSRSSMLSKTNISPQSVELLLKKFDDIGLFNHAELPTKIIESTNKLLLTFENGSTKSVDWLLLATGRKANTKQLGLENTNISINSHGFINTNSHLQTVDENVYAIGDVRSNVMTANQAIADANIVIENIISGYQKEANEAWVPQSIYSALEIARIGYNEDEAEDNGYEPAIGFSAFETSPAAIGQDETDGYVRIISDVDSGKFLGGEIVGDNASELIHLMTMGAMSEYNQSALEAFSQLTVNHPSRAEEIVNATETLASKWGLAKFVFPKQ